MRTQTTTTTQVWTTLFYFPVFFILFPSGFVANCRRVLLTVIDGEAVWPWAPPRACAMMTSTCPRTSPKRAPAQDTHRHEVVPPPPLRCLCSHLSSENSSSVPATSIRFLARLGESESCQHWYIRNTIQAAAICVLFLDNFIFSPQTALNFYNIILSPRSNNICCIKRKVNSFALSGLQLSIYILL